MGDEKLAKRSDVQKVEGKRRTGKNGRRMDNNSKR